VSGKKIFYEQVPRRGTKTGEYQRVEYHQQYGSPSRVDSSGGGTFVKNSGQNRSSQMEELVRRQIPKGRRKRNVSTRNGDSFGPRSLRGGRKGRAGEVQGGGEKHLNPGEELRKKKSL